MHFRSLVYSAGLLTSPPCTVRGCLCAQSSVRHIRCSVKAVAICPRCEGLHTVQGAGPALQETYTPNMTKVRVHSLAKPSPEWCEHPLEWVARVSGE